MFGSRNRYESSLGSGVVISADGYVLTNSHVVGEGEVEVTVGLGDKRELRAKVIGVDASTDLALLKVEARGLPTIPWGDSSQLKVAEWVLAIGSPFQLNQTVTLGIVSALGRANVGIAAYEDFIQTDAAINPGNSGGALINARGELIGINTAIFSQSGGYQGIGFAVPSNLARRVVDDLTQVRRGAPRLDRLPRGRAAHLAPGRRAAGADDRRAGGDADDPRRRLPGRAAARRRRAVGERPAGDRRRGVHARASPTPRSAARSRSKSCATPCARPCACGCSRKRSDPPRAERSDTAVPAPPDHPATRRRTGTGRIPRGVEQAAPRPRPFSV